MLISFTGAQSTGKTTLLKECCDHRYFRKYHCVPEITRKVAREQHVDINEAGDDITQLFILNEHLRNHYIKGDTLLDRCILDGWVYTNYLFNEGKVSQWVKEYAGRLYDKLLNQLDIIFYTDPQDVPIEDDGQRSIDRKFRADIIREFEYEIDNGDFENPILPSPALIRLEGDVNTRMQTILDTVKKYDNSNR
jgi:nicotinamide riboside kinase